MCCVMILRLRCHTRVLGRANLIDDMVIVDNIPRTVLGEECTYFTAHILDSRRTQAIRLFVTEMKCKIFP